jgi:alpha-tubulin suppressor-like RCC1 family protein
MTDGYIACWGGSVHASINDAGPFTSMHAMGHACGLDAGGRYTCSGPDFAGETVPIAGLFTDLAANTNAACAVRRDGNVVCLGGMRYGAWSWSTAARLPAGPYVKVAKGSGSETGMLCAIAADGTVACADDGKTLANETFPSGTYSELSGGREIMCGLRTDQTLDCFGADVTFGVIPPEGTFTSVATGGEHACAIRTDGTLACFGDNEVGQATAPSGTFISVAATYANTCAVRTDGTAVCWGDNTRGQSSPPNGTFTSIATGETHSCALEADGDIQCWGEAAASVPTGHTFTQIAVGNGFTCGLTTRGALICGGAIYRPAQE